MYPKYPVLDLIQRIQKNPSTRRGGSVYLGVNVLRVYEKIGEVKGRT